MFSGDAAESDGRDTVEEVAGFLLNRLTLVVLRRPCRAVVATQDASLGFLDAPCLSIHKGERCRRKEEVPRRRVRDEGDERCGEEGNQEVEGPGYKVDLLNAQYHNFHL